MNMLNHKTEYGLTQEAFNKWRGLVALLANEMFSS